MNRLLVCVAMTICMMSPQMARAQQIASNMAPPVFGTLDVAQVDPGVSPQTPEPAADKEVPPTPQHTGLAALVRTTAADFKAFPRRRSTWVILGIGAGAALLAHPVDPDVNAHLAGSRAVERLWAPGKFVGASATQIAMSV